jgi:hypothetical protein
VFVRKPMRWRVAFGLADIGSAGLTIALGIAMLTFRLDGVSTIASLLAVAASCILAASVLAAIASSILDLRAKDPFDVFHWTGVATLFATIAHLLIVWGITVAMVD